MDKPIVFVDMDNTLNQYWESYVEYYNKIYNDTQHLRQCDLFDYSIAKCLGITDKEETDKLDKAIMAKDEFWLNIPAYENAQDVFEELCNTCNVYIVSMPWKHYKGCVADKIIWIEQKFPYFNTDNIIFTSHKELLIGDYLIDDKPAHLNSFKGKKIAIEYPYNEGVQADLKTTCWFDIEDYILNGG